MIYIYANLSGGSCGWLCMRLRLGRLGLGRLRHWYIKSPTQSLDHTLIVHMHPRKVSLHPSLHLLHLGHPALIPTPQTLYLGLQHSNASICLIDSSSRGLAGARASKRPSQAASAK